MKMQNQLNCTIIALAMAMMLGAVDIHAVCVPCQDVVDDVLNRACNEFAASPPNSEDAMANTAVEIFNGILLDTELCDDGQSVGGSAAACREDLFRLLGVPEPESEPEPEPEPKPLSLSFQSTVTSTSEWDNSLPHGVEKGATVTFFLNQFNSADMTLTDAESCNESDSRGNSTTTVTGCYKNTWELPVNSTYTLTYSSGYTHTATVTKIEIHNNGVEEVCRTINGEVDCRTKKENDSIFFYDGSNKLYEVKDLSNKSDTWLEGEISSDFRTAIEDIDYPDIFDLSFYWGDWGEWGTYHYDYKDGPQETTVVIKTP